MQLAGLQKTTLVDFPGKVAATVFTRGCSFRCGFCHNPELVIPSQFLPLIPERDFFDFLQSRVGKLQGVCITGGEPLLQNDIADFISHIKALGFAVKLDTNGSFPDRLEKIIKDADIDYIAMDIKAPLDKYREVANFQFPISNFQSNSKSQIPKTKKGCHSRLDRESTNSHCEESASLARGEPRWTTRQSDVSVIPHLSALSEAEGMRDPDLSVDPRVKPEDDKLNGIETDIKKSIDLIMNSNIDYEFRTTVCHPLHEVKDFEEIGKMIKGAKRYFIQNFVQSKHINSNINFKPFTDSELKKSQKIMAKFVDLVEIR